MASRKLTDELSLSPQITRADVRAIQEAGFRLIIFNRPDGQAPDPPFSNAIDRAATDRGVEAHYDGYGSYPITVERGKIVLAEYLYGGIVAPRCSVSLIGGTKPSQLAWDVKARSLPPLYWQGMPNSREWLATPETVD
ncbi:MAG: sulfur transferase domain-containing protein [Casimicrobium sp.]